MAFFAYRKGLFLYDLAWDDCDKLMRDLRGREVAKQMIRSTGSILRKPGPIWAVRYDKASLELVANPERTFPNAWIAENRIDVTDDFVRDAQPLIGDSWLSIPLVDGRQRSVRLQPLFAEQGLPAYTPQAYR